MNAPGNVTRARPIPELGPELDFLRLLWRLDHALQRRSKRMQRELGVTGPQRLALRIVGRFPGISTGDLARLLHVHPSTLSGIHERLEARGWIVRRSDPTDRRRVLLGLTEAGRRLDAEDAVTIERAMRDCLSAASPAQLEAARELLLHLAAGLETQPPPSDGSARLAARKTKR